MEHEAMDERLKKILPDNIDELSERDLLLYWGFKSHQIMELPDGTVMPDYDALRQDLADEIEKRKHNSQPNSGE